ncbi:hypothetical protein ACHAXR_011506 [Thalassiosira sp. AJA248-18]
MNPSWKIEELAHGVLQAAQWPGASSIDYGSPTSHLDELERALDIRLPPLAKFKGDTGGSSALRTCTLPNGGAEEPNASGNGNNDVWTWTPQTNTTNHSYSKTPTEDDAAADGRTLEDMAPFSPDFYRALGELAREAFHPGSVKHLDTDKANTNTAAAAPRSDSTTRSDVNHTHGTSTIYKALHSLEQYSLPRMMDAVRITRILLSLQELNVGGNLEQGKGCSFMEYFLHYCEGMNTQAKQDNNSHQKDIVSENNRNISKGKRIPVLSALFHHWGNLPQLEHGLQQLSRKYGALLPTNAGQYKEYCDYSSMGISKFGSETSSMGDGGSTGGEWKPSSSATSFLGDRALRIDSFKMRIEEELSNHINGGSDDKIKLSQVSPEKAGLIELLAMFYQSSDASLRGKCRRWMGQWLRSFALGSGSSVSYSTMRGVGDRAGVDASVGDNGYGPSFASFCPLVMATSLASTNASTGVGGGTLAGAGMGPISISHMAGGNPLGMENTSASGVEALLRVLIRIIMGFHPLQSSASPKDSTRLSGILRPSHEHLLFDVLIPLHRPSGLVLWRDQTPLIGLYHEALVKSIGAFLSMDRTLAGPIIGALLHPEIWPSTEGGNTPKVVLLLHEVDTLTGLLLKSTDTGDQEIVFLASFDAYLLPLVSRLCTCISSENSRTSERALQFFRNKTFQRLVQRRLDEVGYLFLRALCRCPDREVPWNPTVRKMTLLVLQELEAYYKELPRDDDGQNLFCRACEKAFSGVDLSTNDGDSSSDKASNPLNGTAKVADHSSPKLTGDMTSLRGAMGSWKPPPHKAGVFPGKGKSSRQPPLTVTGVAPWAMGGQSRGSRPKAVTSGQKQPPVTITGVAPWAVKKQPHGLPLSQTTRKTSTLRALPRPSKKHSSGSLGQHLPPTPGGDVEICISEMEDESGGQDKKNVRNQWSALDEVHSYMEKLKPKGEDEKSNDGISPWAKAQMEESPVLYPNLKFHDLVFGQDLGTGAFSTVKYARRIVKTRTRSNWPEYAVKVVSTQKIEELGYEQSINREIAILRIFSHPGISRLISSFRFRDGAYLILEYANRGDLHSVLSKSGSLDHDSTRFVIGSVAAALWSIHERGFVYADCKPENILITETGHIKVTDFGGCRPVTQDAKNLVTESSKNLLKQLRDGDWKANATKSSSSDDTFTEKNLENDEEDLRIEGTTAYLPPEVVIGGYPTTAADVWALGCVLFQCVSGRPPILEDTDDLTAQKIVTFDMNSDNHNFFGECSVSAFRPDAKALIQRMLHREVACRPDIIQMADDDFFDGMDIFSLHKNPAHPLDVGSIAPASDAKWSRRQFSSIWAPQPLAYNIGPASNHSPKAGNSQNEPISEEDEADESFLPRQKAPLLTKIREIESFCL